MREMVNLKIKEMKEEDLQLDTYSTIFKNGARSSKDFYIYGRDTLFDVVA